MVYTQNPSAASPIYRGRCRAERGCIVIILVDPGEGPAHPTIVVTRPGCHLWYNKIAAKHACARNLEIVTDCSPRQHDRGRCRRASSSAVDSLNPPRRAMSAAALKRAAGADKVVWAPPPHPKMGRVPVTLEPRSSVEGEQLSSNLLRRGHRNGNRPTVERRT